MHQLMQLFEQPVPDVAQEIAPEDGMCEFRHGEAGREHYFHVGHSALRCIRSAMLPARRSDFQRILDMPSGFGRVLRTLKAAFPQAELTACDLVPAGPDFCATTFGARAVHSTAEPANIRVEGTFDLIWCGSLLTSVSARKWQGFLRLFHSLLEPGGLLIFTTHGRQVARWIRTRTVDYGLEEAKADELIADFDRDGFGYRDYPQHVLDYARIEADYGVAVASPSWVFKQMNTFADLHLILASEHLWDDHQDVFAYLRS
jgi:SAM-dependent methyltransferase